MKTCFAERTCISSTPYLPKSLLDEILETCKNGDYQASQTGDGTLRSSTNSWLHVDNWIAGILHNIMINTNTDYFNYDLVANPSTSLRFGISDLLLIFSSINFCFSLNNGNDFISTFAPSLSIRTISP